MCRDIIGDGDMQDIFISVIVIGYNIELYIEQCIESILNQTYDSFEVIYVDDGSTDATLFKLEPYKEKIKIIKKENGGIISARKFGLREAKGKYIAFVDGDDWLNADMLFNLQSGINEEVDIVCSKLNRQKKDGSFYIQDNDVNCNMICGNDFLELNFLEKICHHMFPKLYKKEFLLKAGYYDYPNITIGEDLLTNIFLGAYQPKVLFLECTNYYYRYNSQSVIRSGDSKLLQQIETLNYIEEFFRVRNLNIQYKDYIEYQWFRYFDAYMLGEVIVPYKIKKEIASVCKEKMPGYDTNIYIKEFLGALHGYHGFLLKGYLLKPRVMAILNPVISGLIYIKNKLIT